MNTFIDFREISKKIAEENTKENLFFLIDQSGMPGLYRRLTHSSVRWTSIFINSREESALEVAPILMSVGEKGRLGLPRAIFGRIGEQGTYTSTVMMLVSEASLECLGSQLSDRLNVILSENMEAMLRFFDPRVFESLLGILTQKQMRNFLSPATIWYYVDRSGCLQQVKGEYEGSHIPFEFLELNQDQEAALLSASEVDQVMASLHSNVPALIAKTPLKEQAAAIVKIIHDVRSERIESIKNLTLYVMIRMADVGGRLAEDDCRKLVSALGKGEMNEVENLLEKFSINFE